MRDIGSLPHSSLSLKGGASAGQGGDSLKREAGTRIPFTSLAVHFLSPLEML